MPKDPVIDLSQINFPDQMNLRLAAVYLNLSEQRVRTLLREEKVPGAVKSDSGAWVLTKEGLDEYKETRKTRGGGTRRGDGKLWQIRVKYKDLEDVREALAEFDIELEPRYNYERQKAYREKRKKEQAAEKAAAAAKAKAEQPAK
jgi:hypothetical protein